MGAQMTAATAPLPAGVSFEAAQKIAQGDVSEIETLAARFKSNKLLPLQPEFIRFFVDLPDDTWTIVRQAISNARIPIRTIDAKMREERVRRAKAGGAGGAFSAAFKAVVALRATEASYEDVCKALLHHKDPAIAEWAKGASKSELRRVYDGAALARTLQLSDFVAFMPRHQFIFVHTGDLWPASSVDALTPSVPAIDGEGDPVFTIEGTRKVDPASVWLSEHASVEQMAWAPGEPQIIKNKLLLDGGWIAKEGVSGFNLYRPPPPLPPGADASKAGPWLDHIKKLYPDDVNHITYHLAHPVQRPWVKTNHGLFLGGPQGIGKDTMLEPVKRAVGSWNFQEAAPSETMGQFNEYRRSVILRISELRDLGEVDRFKFYDHLKTLLAAPPDTLKVNEKHRPPYYVLNVCSVIMLTNYKTDGIHLPSDDRRHYIAWSNIKKEDFPDGYWTALWSWYANGGFGHVAAWLRALDLSGFDPKAPPKKTEAFWAIVHANSPSEDAELADLLDSLGRPPVITLERLICEGEKRDMAAIVEWLKDRKHGRVIPHRLERGGYVTVCNPDAEDGRFKIGERRKTVYGRKDFPVKAHLDAARALADSDWVYR
jgi:hypothetical protein